MKPAVAIKKAVMSFLISDFRRGAKRFSGRVKRRGAPTIHYFHQVDDPYSHLAVQKINALANRYAVRFEFHLAAAPTPQEKGDPERFNLWALRDARSIAGYYNTDLPTDTDTISEEQVDRAQRTLTPLLAGMTFREAAANVGDQLWRDQTLPEPDSQQNTAAAGSEKRRQWGHWLGGSFYFEGEWYWGVDRLLHLEHRLCQLGFSREPGAPILVPRPEPAALEGRDTSQIAVEFYPSLRSPYTAISFDRAITMLSRTGAKLVLKPVVPMMMRGVSASRAKQFYIMTDTKREADYYDVKFGPIVDPFGEPVKRAFALLPLVQSRDLSVDYCKSYLSAAWQEGIDITEDPGLKTVVERIGLDWQDAQLALDNDHWQQIVDQNVEDMLAAGLWGVPSFRVTSPGVADFSCWGQDRLWRVEDEIIKRSLPNTGA